MSLGIANTVTIGVWALSLPPPCWSVKLVCCFRGRKMMLSLSRLWPWWMGPLSACLLWGRRTLLNSSLLLYHKLTHCRVLGCQNASRTLHNVTWCPNTNRHTHAHPHTYTHTPSWVLCIPITTAKKRKKKIVCMFSVFKFYWTQDFKCAIQER